MSFVGIMISFSVNFLLLYTRKSKWNTNLLRWSVTGLLFTIGILGLNEVFQIDHKDFRFFSWCLITPSIYNIFDRLFKFITERVYGRDFYLWLRGSSEIDDSFSGNNPHVKFLDGFFSLLLLAIIICLPLLGFDI